MNFVKRAAMNFTCPRVQCAVLIHSVGRVTWNFLPLQTSVLPTGTQCVTFGTGAGTMSIPAAAKEMIRWVHRPLTIIESWWKDRDFSSLHPRPRRTCHDGRDCALPILGIHQ